MFHILEDLPAHVLGVEASGRITHEDYRDVLIPKIEALAARGPVDMLYVIGADVTGFDLEALWDDAAFGISHWRSFRRIGVVADEAWIRAAVTMFAPLFPCEARLFGLSDLDAARAWIASPPAR
jgi:hypothetical protein